MESYNTVIDQSKDEVSITNSKTFLHPQLTFNNGPYHTYLIRNSNDPNDSVTFHLQHVDTWINLEKCDNAVDIKWYLKSPSFIYAGVFASVFGAAMVFPEHRKIVCHGSVTIDAQDKKIMVDCTFGVRDIQDQCYVLGPIPDVHSHTCNALLPNLRIQINEKCYIYATQAGQMNLRLILVNRGEWGQQVSEKFGSTAPALDWYLATKNFAKLALNAVFKHAPFGMKDAICFADLVVGASSNLVELACHYYNKPDGDRPLDLNLKIENYPGFILPIQLPNCTEDNFIVKPYLFLAPTPQTLCTQFAAISSCGKQCLLKVDSEFQPTRNVSIDDPQFLENAFREMLRVSPHVNPSHKIVGVLHANGRGEIVEEKAPGYVKPLFTLETGKF